jgi:hypothetical protein
MVREGGFYKQFQVDWAGRDGLSPDTHHQYLTEFVNHFFKHVLKLVDRGVRKSTGMGLL